MKKALYLIIFLLITGCAGSSSNSVITPPADGNTATSVMPSITVANLGGRELELPKDLVRHTLLFIVGFSHDQRAAMTAWIETLEKEFSQDNNVDIFKLAVIDSSNAALRSIIRSGMSSAATDDARRKTFTLFTDKALFGQLLGLDLTRPTVLLVNPDGSIKWRSSGEPQTNTLSELKQEILTSTKNKQ